MLLLDHSNMSDSNLLLVSARAAELQSAAWDEVRGSLPSRHGRDTSDMLAEGSNNMFPIISFSRISRVVPVLFGMWPAGVDLTHVSCMLACAAESVARLDLSGNDVEDIGGDLRQYTSLLSLSLSANRLTCLPCATEQVRACALLLVTLEACKIVEC